MYSGCGQMVLGKLTEHKRKAPLAAGPNESSDFAKLS